MIGLFLKVIPMNYTTYAEVQYVSMPFNKVFCFLLHLQYIAEIHREFCYLYWPTPASVPGRYTGDIGNASSISC